MASGVVVFYSPLALGEALPCIKALFFNIKFDALVCDAEELEDQLVMRDPRGNPCGVVPVEHVVLVGGDVVEGNGVGLDSSSAHVPDLVAPDLIIEVLVVSGIRHEERKIFVKPGYFDHVSERVVAKRCCKLLPAIELVIESSVKSRPVIVVKHL